MTSGSELDIHLGVAEALQRRRARGWMVTHIPNGELRHPAVAAKLKAMGVEPGWPDFLLISPQGVPHALELKREKAPLTFDQEAFKLQFEERRLPYAVCRSLEAAITQLTRWGALSGIKVSA